MPSQRQDKVRNYSRRVPQWKKIQQEIEQLTKSYDQVRREFFFFVIDRSFFLRLDRSRIDFNV